MRIWKLGLAILLMAPASALPQAPPVLGDDRLATFRGELRDALPAMNPIPVVQDNALLGFRVNSVSWQHESRGLNARDIVLLPGGPFVLSDTFEQDVSDSLALLLEPGTETTIPWQLWSGDGENREYLYRPPRPLDGNSFLMLFLGPYSLAETESAPSHYANALEAVRTLLEGEGADPDGESALIACGTNACRILLTSGDYSPVGFDVASGEASFEPETMASEVLATGTRAQ